MRASSGGVARHTQGLDTTVLHHTATRENGGWGDLPIIGPGSPLISVNINARPGTLRV